MIDTFSIRCSLLRLAFSGKLAEQRKSDGNARNLLSRISPKKDIEQTENTPYEIPESWAWAKLVDLYQINPKVEADGTTEAAFIPMERICAGFGRSFSFERKRWAQASRNHTKFTDGDVAFAKISPCFENRKSFIAQDLPNGIGGGTTELIVLRQREILPTYTYYLLLDQRFIDTGKASYKGTVGQQRVQSDVLKNFLVPVPPYPEQHRIVARIEQAFSALETIDTLQAQYADNLTVLKSKLIDAAIQGKLTEQLPEDGTAEELYRQIQAEKQALVKAGKIKKEKPLPEIEADEIPFEIPKSWKWVRLGAILSVQPSNGFSPQSVAYQTPYKNLTLTATTSGFFKPEAFKYVSIPPDVAEKYYLDNDDILIQRSNSRDLVGTSCIYRHGSRKYIYPDLMMRIHVMVGINTDFIDYVLKAPLSRAFFIQEASGTSDSMPKINQATVRNTLIPLPPLAEQKRIVERISELLTVCDELKIASKRMEL